MVQLEVGCSLAGELVSEVVGNPLPSTYLARDKASFVLMRGSPLQFNIAISGPIGCPKKSPQVTITTMASFGTFRKPVKIIFTVSLYYRVVLCTTQYYSF